jgi:hypothetical protein
LGVVGAASAQSSADAHAISAATSYYAASERFGYIGTVAVYDTLKDAQHEHHPRSVRQVFPQRDGSLFVVRNAPSYFADANEFLTNWYDDAAHDNGGTANPNNTDLGFIQMYDGFYGEPTTWTQNTGYWDRDHENFTVEVRGQNATYPNSFARLWNAGYPDVGGEGTKGTFITYSYRLKAHGMHAVNRGNNFYTNADNPAYYTGSFEGIFQNLSATSPESNGFYVVHLFFNSTSWADSNGYALNDEFGSNVVRHGDDHDEGD